MLKRRIGDRLEIPARIVEYKFAGGSNSANLPAIRESKDSLFLEPCRQLRVARSLLEGRAKNRVLRIGAVWAIGVQHELRGFIRDFSARLLHLFL